MNDIFDKLIIRFVFTIFICGIIWLYKYAHKFLYPSSKKQMFKKFYPSENNADTVHIFARVIGIALIFSNIGFDENLGVFVSIFHFFVWGSLSFVMYLVSIYICESIILYNFTYYDEVLKRKNMSYSIVSFSIAISLSFIIRKIIVEAEYSIVILLVFWLYSLVLFGIGIKLYQFVSRLSFNKLMIQKNLGLAFSFAGYVLGLSTIIHTAFSQEHLDIKRYGVQVSLSVILSIIIFPIFQICIRYVFRLKEDLFTDQDNYSGVKEISPPEIGYGLYEGGVYYTACLLTSIIVGQIHFGIIYPFF
jgi:uncharacterized membrane protein YjfL (UPF0719 family)